MGYKCMQVVSELKLELLPSLSLSFESWLSLYMFCLLRYKLCVPSKFHCGSNFACFGVKMPLLMNKWLCDFMCRRDNNKSITNRNQWYLKHCIFSTQWFWQFFIDRLYLLLVLTAYVDFFFELNYNRTRLQMLNCWPKI